MIAEIECTCEAVPSQWEGRLEDGTYFYARYRGARIRIGFGASLTEAISKGIQADKPNDRMFYERRREDVDPLDGYMTWDEMLPYFLEAENRRYPDGCVICKGQKGGVRGNENIVDNLVVCDYCHAEMRNETSHQARLRAVEESAAQVKQALAEHEPTRAPFKPQPRLL